MITIKLYNLTVVEVEQLINWLVKGGCNNVMLKGNYYDPELRIIEEKDMILNELLRC